VGTEQYWHGILPHSGEPGRRYEEIRGAVRDLAPILDRLGGGQPEPEVALLFSYDHLWALQIQRHHPDLGYVDHLAGYYRALHRMNVPVDFVPLQSDLGRYRLIVAPLLFLMTEKIREKLLDFVDGGGHLLLTMRSGVKDWNNRVNPAELPGLLAELAGITVVDYDCLRRVEQGIRWTSEGSGEAASPRRADKWADIIDPREADTLAVYTHDYYAGRAAVTRRAAGEGTVTYVGTELDEKGHEELARLLCDRAGVTGLLRSAEPLEVVHRRGRGEDLFFILNHGDEPARVDVPGQWSPVLAPEAFGGGELTLAGYDLAVFAAPSQSGA
jgi:beta-galactosidase